MQAVSSAEAIPLLGAFACRLARQAGIRALLIKGRPATDLGVRANRPSVDVDVWVDPRRRADYLALLGDHGWHRASGTPDGVGWGHATTMTHAGWACTVDVHHAFPGFLTADQAVFDHVWRARAEAHLGGQAVAGPEVVTAAAISVLHGARSWWARETNADTAAALTRAAAFDDGERTALADLVRVTRSAVPLEPLMVAAGVHVDQTSRNDERLAEWQARTTGQGLASVGWLIALRNSSWRRRPMLLVAALRPSASDYAAARGFFSRGRTARAVIHRLHRAVPALPRAVKTLHQAFGGTSAAQAPLGDGQW